MEANTSHQSGTRVGPYELLAPIGAGGMGEVWKARDSRLDRIVAVKFATTEFSQRFESEARAISALNHPHICQLYDIGPDYLVMEFVDGHPLNGPLNVQKALQVAGQILDALHAAHSMGIVHRDLKPPNILVTRSGVKLLDFGIAKTMTRGFDVRTQTATLAGEVIGTLEYMSPEQLQGQPVDARSDLFSFGCVLYELLSGRQPFASATAAQVISAVLDREPAPLDVPPALARVVRTCLAKNREERFQTALDLKRALAWSVEPQAAAAPRWFHSIALAAAVVAGAAVALAVTQAFVLLRAPTPPPIEYGTVRLTYDDGLTTDPALSPDGKLVAFASDRSGENHLDIYLQQTAGGPAVRLTNTDGDDHEPAFSPDGSTIVFRSEREGGGLYAVPALGGDARHIVHGGHDPRFSPDGRYIAYVTEKAGTDTVAVAGRCYVVPVVGGQPRLVTPEFGGATWPVWITNQTLLFLGAAREGGLHWWTVDVENPRPAISALLPTSARGAALNRAGNQLVFVSGTTEDSGGVWMVPFDPRSARATGPPRQLLAGMGDSLRVAVANGGTMVLARTHPSVNIWSLPLEGQAAPAQLTFNAASKSLPDISPDGRHLVYVSSLSGGDDVYLRDLVTGREATIGATRMRETHPIFTARGTGVAFAQYAATLEQRGDRPPALKVLSYPVSGGALRPVADVAAGRFDQLSEDGRFILLHGGREPALTVYDVTTRTEAVVVRAASKAIFQPRLTPDGDWITFLVKADENDSRIYAARFRGTQPIPPAEWIPLTQGDAGDDKPRLSADRRRLFFTSKADGHRCIWIQELDPATLRPIGKPTAFQHFHSARRSLARVLSNLQEIAVGDNRVIFNMAETTGNLWLFRPNPTTP